MAIHNEIEFENEICKDLAAAGWLHDKADDAHYDRARALFPADVIAWLEATQPDQLSAVRKMHGKEAERVILDRLRQTMDQSGTLHVLRNGFEVMGLRKSLQMAQFRPALAMNADLEAKYLANRLRVIRQLHYSQHNNNSLDLGLFLNGIPVATTEIKTDYTQAVENAMYQYKSDRLPKVAGKNVTEPLLHFPGAALVHFAVSNSQVAMTTKLAGMATHFLPFNMGCNGGAGNPPNPNGYATDYLWKAVWQRDSWLEILSRYLIPTRNKKKQIVDVIFPRFHQLDITRQLVRAVMQDGPGGKYLGQHSPGSGKTNSIAWTAHFFADLHDADNKKVFDSVIVVSDRTVLDDQLQEALSAFERTKGVVAVITGEGKSKSQDLAKALSEGKKIICCTLQTFPFALKAVQDLAATQGKCFAVIADEAHSSQTNETAIALKAVLSAEELKDLEDGGEIDTEAILQASMASKANDSARITYVAYTATPKDKTLQLFGTRPDPTQPPGPENIPHPFHVYPMRQAIEEGFILDVLQNYIPYKVAFNLTNEGKAIDVDKNTALKGIMGWVRLHEYNIAQRVGIVIEHFRAHVQHLLGGKAKAMVVTGSRKEAVRWQVAMRKYIKEHGYKLDTLVAFSGEVIDLDTDKDPIAETSAIMNPGLKGRGIREAFKEGEYQILLVANKFQTGFDEPLLCGMYVDRKLSGLQAVQTLSRLNRAYPGKKDVFIVDFINDEAEILIAFRKYYDTAELSGVTDPSVIFTLRAKLDGQELYDDADIESVTKAVLVTKKQSAIDAALVPVATRLLHAYKKAAATLQTHGVDTKAGEAAKHELDALILFKRDIGTYVRLYAFLSQIYDYGNTDIEKRSIFFRLLHRLLDYGRDIETVDLSSLALTHYSVRDLGQRSLNLSGVDPVLIDPTGDPGSGKVRDKERESLDAIISMVNDLFVGDLTPGDKLVYVNNAIKGKLLEYQVLIEQAMNSSKEQFADSPDLDTHIMDAIMEAMASFETMSNQALGSPDLRKELKKILLGPVNLYEALRDRGEQLH